MMNYKKQQNNFHIQIKKKKSKFRKLLIFYLNKMIESMEKTANLSMNQKRTLSMILIKWLNNLMLIMN
jgi:hypothetical protein